MDFSIKTISNNLGCVFATVLLLGSFTLGETDTLYADESKTIEQLIELTEPKGREAQRKMALLESGEQSYLQFCVHCHGLKGQGDGKASAYLRPLPRDLSLGIFKFRSTPSNAIPRNKDLYRTIKNGIPGTAMPAWGEILAEETISSLVEYLKSFSSRFHMERPDHVLPIGLEPPYEKRSVEKGRELYMELRCGRCHGDKGEREGRLENQLNDAWGHPSMVYDLKQPWLYKAGSSADEVYHTLVTGMDGTPMSAYDYVPAEELWHLVHYLQSRYRNEKRAPFPVLQYIVSLPTSKKIDSLPENPVWNEVESVSVKLMALQSQSGFPSVLNIQSLRDNGKIAFRLQWQDETPETAKSGAAFYLDAVALQFAVQPLSNFESIYYGMGERKKAVNIWHWKADSFQTVEGRKETWDNLALDPFRENSIEEINASGFGTLTVQSIEDQQVTGQGEWRNGKWTVVFVRDLKTASPFDVQFPESGQVLVAFALWDGLKKEKNAHKKVSFWQKLLIQ